MPTNTTTEINELDELNDFANKLSSIPEPRIKRYTQRPIKKSPKSEDIKDGTKKIEQKIKEINHHSNIMELAKNKTSGKF